jgi:hypothetical protein
MAEPTDDEIVKRLEAYLATLTPDKQAELANTLNLEVHEVKQFEKHLDSLRFKGLKKAEDMIFEVISTVVCTTCGSHFVQKVMSSNTKPMFHTTCLCGKCHDVLMTQPLADVVHTLLEKEKIWGAKRHLDYKPVYIPPTDKVYEVPTWMPLPSNECITEQSVLDNKEETLEDILAEFEEDV